MFTMLSNILHPDKNDPLHHYMLGAGQQLYRKGPESPEGQEDDQAAICFCGRGS